MTWWNRKPPADVEALGRPVEDPVDLEALKTLAEPESPKSEPPPPDLSTKPKDIVGFCFGYVCPKKHVNSTFENIMVDEYKERRACQMCGGVAKPAVVKRTAEAKWENRDSSFRWQRPAKPDWRWSHYYNLSGFVPNSTRWTEYEFVHYLDTPKRRKK